eukprot:scaffold7123_cov119-Isochrysis_galbana.AAC.12
MNGEIEEARLLRCKCAARRGNRKGRRGALAQHAGEHGWDEGLVGQGEGFVDVLQNHRLAPIDSCGAELHSWADRIADDIHTEGVASGALDAHIHGDRHWAHPPGSKGKFDICEAILVDNALARLEAVGANGSGCRILFHHLEFCLQWGFVDKADNPLVAVPTKTVAEVHDRLCRCNIRKHVIGEDGEREQLFAYSFYIHQQGKVVAPNVQRTKVDL